MIRVQIELFNKTTGHSEIAKFELDSSTTAVEFLPKLSALPEVSLLTVRARSDHNKAEAAAEVREFHALALHNPRHNLVVAQIFHAQQTADCKLQCLGTDKSSPGPCIDCPDGDFVIRLCC